MECPKCRNVVNDNQLVCPHCQKVLQLECPNCHTLNESGICSHCGYSILVKCAKCSKINHTKDELCLKCKFPIKTSLAYQECETDEFAAIVVSYGSLKNIRRLLKSQELYSKFFHKLKNLLYAQINGVECKLITYGDTFVINFNKELSLATSSNKAVRLALKIANAFVLLNSKVLEEFSVPLNLNLSIIKKNAEELQNLTVYSSNVKSLAIKKDEKKYLKGLKIILDQYIWDNVNKDFKTDSLYNIEADGKTVMFYEIIPDSYILPPNESDEEKNISVLPSQITTNSSTKEDDLYSFKVFDINAKCSFENLSTTEVMDRIRNLDLETKGKILALRSEPEYGLRSNDLVTLFETLDYKVVRVCVTEKLNYKPWGFFEEVFSSYYDLPFDKKLIRKSDSLDAVPKRFKAILDTIQGMPIKAMTPEDARFAYMEEWGNFLGTLNKTVIIIEGFEYLDDTSIQTLELYFDKFKNIKPNFVFITGKELAVHSKIKTLLRTSCYTEFSLKKSDIDLCLATLKSDATDFIQSFYFEKIKENFKGSYLYFQNAIDYLKESNILVDFEGKLIVKSKKAVIVPKDLRGLYKCRLKTLSKNQDLSLILAYASMLSFRLDFSVLKQLDIKDIEKNLELIEEYNLGVISGNSLYINNYNFVSPIMQLSIKKEVELYLVKNLLAKAGNSLGDVFLFSLMGVIKAYKEEYLTLWKIAQLALKTGDYDAYLKSCLGFLSLVEYIEDSNLSKEQIEENKKDVYNNILMYLYGYSPSKIYYIENLLLMDAINENDDEKVVKLSNLMLQGALISANYKDALSLLHNILTRMKNATLIVDGAVNTKFLLLSLVNIEILYNIGDYTQVIELGEKILSVLNPDILDKIKPASFSINLFVSHLLDTFRLVALSKMYLLDEDLEEFYEGVAKSLNTELPDKDCIIAVQCFLSGKEYFTQNVEEYSPYSKIIFLILQEFSVLEDDYKRFAQNIYQAKLLADDINQMELKLFCDLLIAYSYYKLEIYEKSEKIYKDVLAQAEKSAMFNILMLSRYLYADLKFIQGKSEESLILINDSLDTIQRYKNSMKIFYVLFEKLYIKIAQASNLTPVDVENEEQKLLIYSSTLSRLVT